MSAEAAEQLKKLRLCCALCALRCVLIAAYFAPQLRSRPAGAGLAYLSCFRAPELGLLCCCSPLGQTPGSTATESQSRPKMSYTGSFPSGQKKHPGHILWLISARGSTGGLIKPLGATQSHSKAPKAQKGDFFTPPPFQPLRAPLTPHPPLLP